jgi:hypothetical protein
MGENGNILLQISRTTFEVYTVVLLKIPNLLGCDVMSLGVWFLMFGRILTPSGSSRQFQKLLGPETWMLRHKGKFY